jgi:hypothetical protein
MHSVSSLPIRFYPAPVPQEAPLDLPLVITNSSFDQTIKYLIEHEGGTYNPNVSATVNTLMAIRNGQFPTKAPIVFEGVEFHFESSPYVDSFLDDSFFIGGGRDVFNVKKNVTFKECVFNSDMSCIIQFYVGELTLKGKAKATYLAESAKGYLNGETTRGSAEHGAVIHVNAKGGNSNTRIWVDSFCTCGWWDCVSVH